MNRDIIRAAREGERHAKDVLSAWLYVELRALFAKDKQRQRVEDLIQAALVDIFGKLAISPDDPDLFRGFVHSFAKMEVRECTRDRGREFAGAAALRQEPHTPPESPSELVLVQQERQLLLEHAQQLRPVYRDALLHVLDGGDYKSLAAMRGINESTAASRIWYATERVGRMIEAEPRTPLPYRARPLK